MLSANLVFFFVSAVLSVDFFLILSVQVRLSATSLSEVALKVWQAPCTLSASVGPASPNWAKCKCCTCTVCTMALWFGPRSQSIGRGRISREGALDHRESRERRDKIFAAQTVKRQNFQKRIWIRKTVFSGEFSFFGRGKTNFFGGGYNFKTG